MPLPVGDESYPDSLAIRPPPIGAVEFKTNCLSGSPGQVEWAEAIRARVNDEFNRVEASFRAVARTQCGSKRRETEEILAILQDKRIAVLSHDQVGYFIRDWQEISDQVRQMIGQDSRYRAIKAERTAGKSLSGDR